MASSSGLYGEATLPTVTLAEPSSPTGQDVSSTNSTSLYGGAATPIPDSSGNLVVRGDLIVLSGNVLTTATEGNIFPANATTVNIGLAGTAVNIGAGTGTTTVNNNLAVAGDLTINGAFIAPDAQFGNITIAVADDQTITTTTGRLVLQSASGEIDTGTTNLLSTNSTSFNLLNSPTTVNAFNGATALALGAATGTTTIRNDATVSGDLRINGNDIKSSANTTAISLSGTNVTIANDFTVNGNNVNLAQATVIGYSESNNRLNRPTVKSTTGNTSGLRVEAPNATTSASSSFTAFSSNDADNGKFINITARGATSSDLRIQTGKYTAGVLDASGTVVSFVDNITTYATVNPAGPTDPSDLTTKSYVDGLTPNVPTYDTNVAPVTGGIDLQLREIDIPSITIVGSTKFIGGTNVTISETSSNEVTISAPDTNTTYTIDASSTTGGANLNLAGSDASTDTVKFASGTGISVAQTDANTITVNSTITQYTDAQARASISATGSLTYNSTTGVIDYTTPTTIASLSNHTTTDLAEGTNLYYTDARARASISATGDISYNSTTGVISYTAPAAPVTSVNGKTGAVVLTTTDISEGTNLYYTDARARAALSAGTGIGYNSTTGVISNSGVTALAGSNHISVDASTGSITVTSDATSSNTVSTIIARDSSGNFSAGTATLDKGLVGSTANFTDWPNAQFVASQANGGDTHPYNMGIVGEAVADASDANRWGIGVYGNGFTNGAQRSGGVLGDGSVTNTADTGSAIGVRGYATDTHAGGMNIGLYGNASGSGVGNYALYMNDGNIFSNIAQTWTVLDNNASALSIDATGKTGILKVVSTDGAEGVTMSGTLGVTGIATIGNGSRVLGALTATPSTTYTFPAPPLATITDNNGIDAISSYNTNPSTLGNGAQGQFTHFIGDTLAGANTTAVFSLKSANGNSETTGTVPFTGLAPVAASAVTSANVLGGLNFNGYATSGFTDYVGTQNQGGGYNAVHALQIQAAPVETFADSTLTISGATITAVSRVNAAQTVTAVAGTRGQLTIPSTLAGVGTAVVVTGTNSGTATGISAGTYYIIANNGGAGNSTQITISATVGGAPITTTAGTVTGLTFTRQLITVTYSAQTNIPFGQNAKVAISGFTNVTAGTFMCIGSSTATTVTIGATSSGTPALSGSQSVSCLTVTAGGTLFRVRGFAAATPLNSANRIEYINHAVATATYKSNQFNFQGGTNAFNYLAMNAALAEFRIGGPFNVKDLAGTNTNLSVDSTTGDTTVRGNIRVNGNNIQGSGGVTALTLTAANTVTTLKADLKLLQSNTPATFTMTGSTISGTTLTVGTLSAGTIAAGSILTGTGVTANTYVISNIAGGIGSGSTWLVSTSQTVASTTITGTKQNLITNSLGLSYDRTYGDFSSTVTQTNAGATSVNLVTFDTTNYSSQVSIVSGTRITVGRAGSYQIQWSGQCEKTDNGTDQVTIWLRQNGVDIPNSSGVITLAGNNAKTVAAWTYSVTAAVNDYFELCWFSPDIHVEFVAIPAGTTPTRPAAPSVAMTITPIGA